MALQKEMGTARYSAPGVIQLWLQPGFDLGRIAELLQSFVSSSGN